MRRSWPDLPQMLTCLITGLVFSLAVFIPSGKKEDVQSLYITTTGNTADIKHAIAALDRHDISIRAGGTGPSMTQFQGWILILVSGTIACGLGWAGMSRLDLILRSALSKDSAKP